MTSEKKISPAQLMILLVLARVMHTMIFRSERFGTGVPMMLGLLLSTAIEAVLALPAVIYFTCGGADPAEYLAGRFGVWLRVLYSGYFAVIGGATAALFTGFLESEFADITRPLIAMALLTAAAAYCSCGGIEGLARAGAVVFWLFAVLFAVMAAVNEGGFDMLNFSPMTSSDMPVFWRYVFENLSSAWWLPMLCALGVHLKKGAAAASFGYLGLKLIITEALLFLITAVLAGYVDVLGYPIFALGAYAKSDFIQRFDAINMLVWAINCVTVTAVYIYIISKPAGSAPPACAVSALAVLLIAAAVYRSGLKFDDPAFLIFKAAGVVILGVLVPSAAGIKLICKKRRNGA